MEVRERRVLLWSFLLTWMVSLGTSDPGRPASGHVHADSSPFAGGIGPLADSICAYCCLRNWWQCIQYWCYSGSCGSGYNPFLPDWNRNTHLYPASGDRENARRRLYFRSIRTTLPTFATQRSTGFGGIRRGFPLGYWPSGRRSRYRRQYRPVWYPSVRRIRSRYVTI